MLPQAQRSTLFPYTTLFRSRNLRIVFMGTPEFAVSILKKILKEGYNIVGVITAPDKPAGRGRKLQESAVKTFAMSQGLRVLDRKSTRLNSSHVKSSYAVFCL